MRASLVQDLRGELRRWIAEARKNPDVAKLRGAVYTG